MVSSFEYDDVLVEQTFTFDCNQITQCWTFTNQGSNQIDNLSITPYIDGDLYFMVLLQMILEEHRQGFQDVFLNMIQVITLMNPQHNWPCMERIHRTNTLLDGKLLNSEKVGLELPI